MLSDHLARAALAADRWRCGLRAKFCMVGEQPWHYLEGGVGKRETIVLLHGFGADKDNWTRFAGRLRANYHVIAVDLPGFGENPCRQGLDYSMAAQTERLRGLLSALGVGRCHMAGSSMGGHLTAVYAQRYPQQLRSICLFNNGGIQAPERCDMERDLEKGGNPLLVSSESDFDRLLALVCEKQPFLPRLVRNYMARAAMARRECIAAIFRQYQQEIYGGLDAVLPALSLPALVIWGRQDRVLDVSSVEVMRPMLPHASVTIMEQTGHLPMLERPAASAKCYHQFLSSLA